MKRYELTTNTIQHFGRTLHKIRSLVDITGHGVKAGEYGGWIESEGNLPQHEASWVFGDAWVFGTACISGGQFKRTPLQIAGMLPWFVNASGDNDLRIGCECHSVDYWKTHLEAIAGSHNVENQIENVRAVISLAKEWWLGQQAEKLRGDA